MYNSVYVEQLSLFSRVHSVTSVNHFTMGGNDDKENKSDGDKSRSKSRDSGKGGVPKTATAGTANGGNNVPKDVAGQVTSASGAQAPVVSGPSGKGSGTSSGSASKRVPLARLGGRSPSVDNVVPVGLANVAEQMRVKSGDQVLMNSMVDMVSRMERSNQAMMDLMLQQAHANNAEKGSVFIF